MLHGVSNSIDFFPVCMESSGTLGEEGKAFFKAIAQYADALDQGMSYDYVLGLLLHASAVTVQKGNYLIMTAEKRAVLDYARTKKPLDLAARPREGDAAAVVEAAAAHSS